MIQAPQTSIGPSVLLFLHGVVGERSVLRLPTEVSIRLGCQHIPVGGVRRWNWAETVSSEHTHCSPPGTVRTRNEEWKRACKLQMSNVVPVAALKRRHAKTAARLAAHVEPSSSRIQNVTN